MTFTERILLVVGLGHEAGVQSDQGFSGNVRDGGGAEVVDRDAGLCREVTDVAVNRIAERPEVGLGELVGLRVLVAEVPQAGLRCLLERDRLAVLVAGRFDAE